MTIEDYLWQRHPNINLFHQAFQFRLQYQFITLAFNSASAHIMADTNHNPTYRVHEEQEGEGEHVVFFNATRHEHELCLLKVCL